MALKIFGANSIGSNIQGNLGTTDNATVAAGVIVGSTDNTAIQTAGSNQFVTVDGSVFGANSAVRFDNSDNNNNHLLVGAEGKLQGFASTAVVSLSAESVIENRGSILGATGAITVLSTTSPGFSQINNSGTIESIQFQAIVHAGEEELHITNSGLIRSQDKSSAFISFSAANEFITNTGTIAGRIEFGSGDDIYQGRDGHLAGNLVDGGDGNDFIVGGVENDNFRGGNGNDQLDGGAGGDTLDGGVGADFMAGGAGSDLYFVNNAADLVSEISGSGFDFVASSVNFSLANTAQAHGVIEDLTLLNGATVGTGNGLANEIRGNAAANVLNGGLGHDTLIGDSGADSFVFNTKVKGLTNVDTISDFNHAADTMRLENGVFTKLAGIGTLSKAQFHAGASGLAHDANDRIIYETDTGKVFYDANGNAAGGAVQIALLSNHTAINNTDFFIF